MTIYTWQKELLKSMLIDPLLKNISNVFKNNKPLIEPLIIQSLMGQLSNNSLKDLFQEHEHEEFTSAFKAFNLLSKIHNDKVYIANDYEGTCQTVGELRLAMYEIIITFLNDNLPERELENPKLNSITDNGMGKIKALFKDYITLTNPSTIERYKIALEILIEKEALKLPSFISSEENLFITNASSTPGDFSYLDLSHLKIERTNDAAGSFKALQLYNSNLEGTIITGIDLFGANFSRCNLLGADITNNLNVETAIIDDTKLIDTYIGEVLSQDTEIC